MDEMFELWLKRVVEIDDRYNHLTDLSYEDERADFYVYYLAKFTPEMALQQEYHEYG